MDLPETMAAVEIAEPGGPDVLKPTRRPTPQPGPGEVLIRVRAAGVNRPDVLQRQGLYPPPEGASDLPGLEAAGEIVALGEDVSDRAVGETVVALLPGGGYAEFATANAGHCLSIPPRVSIAESAGLPETVFTVWANVFEDGALKAGETLLVHGGTSGIGATAVQMAKAAGARVIVTCGSAEKCAAARELGADLAINYRTEDFAERVDKDGGADVILDMVAGDYVERNLQCLKPGGRLVFIAFLGGSTGTIDIFAIMRKRLRISGSTLRARSTGEKARLARAIEETVWPWYADRRAQPVLDRTFPLAEASAAHELMEAGGHVGKIVLVP
ncbi:MAG: NAD(P)H-quinone oxidoreductase [Pseudomonadota bacterium]